MPVPLPLEAFPVRAAGALMVVLALAVLALGPLQRLHRALALVLVVRGMLNLLPLDPRAPAEDYLARVDVYFELAAPFAMAYFALTYRDPQRARASSQVALPLLLVGVVAAELLFALDHRFWATSAAPGPLNVVSGLKHVLYASLALLLALDHGRAPAGPKRRSLLAASVGFALDPLYLGALGLAAGLGAGDLFGGDSEFHSPPLLRAAALLPMAAMAWLLVRRLRGPEAEPGEERRLRLALAALWVTLASAAVVLVVQALAPGAARPLAFLLDGVWTLAFPLLVTYAILAYQLLGIELQVKRGIRAAALAAPFLALLLLLLLVAGEAAQATDQSATVVLGMAAGAAFMLALPRLRQLADKVAEGAMPGVAETPEYVHRRRCEVYRAALEQAMAADGTIPRDQAAVLGVLRAKLHIAEAEHRRILAEVVAAAVRTAGMRGGAGSPDA